MSQDWRKCDAKEIQSILKTVNPSIQPVPFSPETTSIRARQLSFYADVDFYEMTDLSAVPAARKYAMVHGKDVHMINWTNDPIYTLNKTAGLVLTRETIGDYVRFFFSYVRGRHGWFKVVQTLDDFTWQTEPPLQGRRAIQDMIHPVKLLEEKDGVFTLQAYMMFHDSLFSTLIHVPATGDAAGTVDMTDEELKIEGMPVVQDVVIA